jgi:hypothetical protein
VTTTNSTKLILLLLLVVFALPSASKAGSILSLAKASNSKIEVRLRNDEPVAAIQFAVRCSQNISLENVTAGDRTSGSVWMLSSNKVDDSTLYVVLIRTGQENLTAGSGTIAGLTIRVLDNGQNAYRISFDNVVASSPSATSLAISFESLEWSTDAPSFVLGQNYPNPFNPSTTIPYVLQEPSLVNLTVYDIAGREIRRISEGMVSAGEHAATWNSSDESGSMVPSGVYFVRLQVDDKFEVRKMVLTK